MARSVAKTRRFPTKIPWISPRERSEEKVAVDAARFGVRGRNFAWKEVLLMLFGEFRHAVDAKNRLFIPAKFREQLGESFIVIRSATEDAHYLSVYSQEGWADIEARLAEQPRARTRDINRFWGRNGLEVSPDSQGRILLTQALIDYTGLDKSAVVIGCGRYAEIWSEDAYERMIAAEDAAAFNQQLLDMGV